MVLGTDSSCMRAVGANERTGFGVGIFSVILLVSLSTSVGAQESSCFAGDAGANPTIAIAPVGRADGVAESTALDLVVLHQTLERAILKTQEFDVVSIDPEDQRSNLALEELNRLDPDRRQDLGSEIRGVDTILKPRVDRFVFDSSFGPIPGLSKWRRRDSGAMDVTVEAQRVGSNVTSQVISVSASVGTGERIVDSNRGRPSAALYKNLVEKLGDRFAGEIAALLKPPIVADTTGGDIWITRGSDQGVEQGNQFEVFRPGREIRHPVTGEVLGTTETLVGRIRIVRVLPKLAMGRATGELESPIETCDVVRSGG